MNDFLAILLTLVGVWWASFSNLPFMVRVALVVSVVSIYRLFGV
jgi:hypothetical protein